LAASIALEKERARARKIQARGRRRGEKALSRSQDRHRESADAIGAAIGVSGSTVKRVDRVAREAPELLPKVAAGELSVRRAMRTLGTASESEGPRTVSLKRGAQWDGRHVANRLLRLLRAERERYPREARTKFLQQLRECVEQLEEESASVDSSSPVERAHDDHRPRLSIASSWSAGLAAQTTDIRHA
jgi:hypothetical protein